MYPAVSIHTIKWGSLKSPFDNHTQGAGCVWLAVNSDTVYSSVVNPSSAINDESMEHNVIAQQTLDVMTETSITRVLLVWGIITEHK